MVARSWDSRAVAQLVVGYHSWEVVGGSPEADGVLGEAPGVALEARVVAPALVDAEVVLGTREVCGGKALPAVGAASQGSFTRQLGAVGGLGQ